MAKSYELRVYLRIKINSTRLVTPAYNFFEVYNRVLLFRDFSEYCEGESL